MARQLSAWMVVLAATVAGAAAGVAALPGPAIAAECDGKGTPCPLQKWMRANVGGPMAGGDLAAVAKSMETARKFGGPDMKDWDKFAKKAADDAAAGKTDDVKADCKSCHDAYKEAYKKDGALRNKAIP